MSQSQCLRAIILDKNDFRENDLIVTIYGQGTGRLNLVARGAKKPSSKLVAHLEPLSLSAVMLIRGQAFDYVGSAVNDCFYPKIKGDWDKLVIASEAFRSFLSLINEGEGSDSDYIFELLENFLSDLESSVSNYEAILAVFWYDLLASLGYGPNFQTCLECNQVIMGERWFDFLGGGCICQSCWHGRINQNDLQKISLPTGLVLQTWGDNKTIKNKVITSQISQEILVVFRKFLAYIK